MSTTPIDLSRRRTSGHATLAQSTLAQTSFKASTTASARQPERAHDGFIPTSAPTAEAAPRFDYVALAYSPNKEQEANPLRGLVSDELYVALRSNDLINEKGLRDFIIRSVFKQMKDEQRMKTVDAIVRLQEIYPYLQIDTIRKIVYRIAPGNQRKAMI